MSIFNNILNCFSGYFSSHDPDADLGPRTDTPIHKAAGDNDVGQIRSLIESHADVMASGRYGWTALHHAAFRGHELAVCTLLENRANVDEGDDYKQTPLYLATFQKHIPTIEILLGHGADMNKADAYRSTPAQIMPHYIQQMQVLRNLRFFSSQRAQSSD